MNRAIEVIPIATPAAREKLAAAAAADGHDVSMATHYLVGPDGELIGTLGLPKTATVHVWMNTKTQNPRNTLDAVKLLHGLMTANGMPHYCIPCPVDSPLYPFAKRVGMGVAKGDYKLLYSAKQEK
jgi:hypothetical protein